MCNCNNSNNNRRCCCCCCRNHNNHTGCQSTWGFARDSIRNAENAAFAAVQNAHAIVRNANDFIECRRAEIEENIRNNNSCDNDCDCRCRRRNNCCC